MYSLAKKDELSKLDSTEQEELINDVWGYLELGTLKVTVSVKSISLLRMLSVR